LPEVIEPIDVACWLSVQQ